MDGNRIEVDHSGKTSEEEDHQEENEQQESFDSSHDIEVSKEHRYQLRTPLYIKPSKKTHETILLLQQQIGQLKQIHQEKDELIRQLQQKLVSENTQRQLQEHLKQQQAEIMELKNKLSNIHSRGTTERQREDSNNEFESDGDVRKNNSRSGFDKRRFQEAKQEQQKIMLLTMQVQQLEKQLWRLKDETRWVQNFLGSFLAMTEQISQLFNEKVIHVSWNTRKKVKVAWRYLKHILNYLLPLC